MRRWAWAVTAAMGTVLLAATVALPATAASAAPVPLPSPSPGTSVCTIDKELGWITGLAVTANGYAVAVKANPGINVKVYLLDAGCKRTGRTLAYSADRGPRDPQDLQIAADGTYWVADTGDDPTNPTRPNVGVWKLTTDGRATLYRLSYPDRPQSAQALLVSGNGTPVIITDNPRGAAGIYVPSGPLDSGHAVQLKHAGDFTPQDTGTENKLGKIGMTRVTGAATSPDGKHVAIRTFSDAYEWSVTNGDVVGAITAGTPKITPLPNEPQGSAIAYARDGTNFLTVSDLNREEGVATQILRYRASPPPAPAKPTPAAPGIAAKGDTRTWFDKLSLQDMLRIVGAVGVLGLLMVIGGVIGIRQARRNAAEARRRPPPDDDADVLNGPTAAMAEMRGGRRERYGDRYEYPDPHYGSAGPYPPPDTTDRYPGPAAPGSTPPGVAPPGIGRRTNRGIARSHRPGGTRRGGRDTDDPGRRGYPDQHEGFGDILDS
jgi:hypothetical protein